MAPMFYFSDFLKCKDHIALGRLVTNVYQPYDDYHDPNPSIEEEHIMTSPVRNFAQAVQGGQSLGFRLTLANFLNVDLTKSSEHDVQIQGATATSYSLSQPLEQFKKLCTSESTREWMSNAIRYGTRVHMVVKVLTVTNPSFQQTVCKRRGTGIGTNEGALVNVFPGADHATSDSLLSTTGNADSARGSNLSYEMEGEQIVGLCYRRIRFRWLRPSATSAKLGLDNVWKVSWSNRSTTASPNPSTLEALLDEGDETNPEEEDIRFVTFDFEDEDDDEEDTDDEVEGEE